MAEQQIRGIGRVAISLILDAVWQPGNTLGFGPQARKGISVRLREKA
jgi:hypothetical protein